MGSSGTKPKYGSKIDTLERCRPPHRRARNPWPHCDCSTAGVPIPLGSGASVGLTRFLHSVRSQVLSSHRTTQPCLVLSCSGIWPARRVAGSVIGRRRNSCPVDEGCRVTFFDRLARRYSLFRVRRRLVEPGLYPASCLCAQPGMRESCWMIDGVSAVMVSSWCRNGLDRRSRISSLAGSQSSLALPSSR